MMPKFYIIKEFFAMPTIHRQKRCCIFFDYEIKQHSRLFMAMWFKKNIWFCLSISILYWDTNGDFHTKILFVKI